ncbi:hypothetical protein GOP47_0011005, partial [Adiantum capillus-veneris]
KTPQSKDRTQNDIDSLSLSLSLLMMMNFVDKRGDQGCCTEENRQLCGFFHRKQCCTHTDPLMRGMAFLCLALSLFCDLVRVCVEREREREREREMNGVD